MHDHTHNNELSSQRIGWAFALNVGFTIIEFVRVRFWPKAAVRRAET